MIGVHHIRVSQTAKSQLSALKRRTGIKQWNILCRWAFCLSISLDDPPKNINVVTDSNIDISWQTFTGNDNEFLYWALLKARCVRDHLELDDATLNKQFLLHLHRGISYLSTPGKIKSLPDLIELAVSHKISETPN